MRINQLNYFWAILNLLCAGIMILIGSKNWVAHAISDEGIISILTIAIISISLAYLFNTTQKLSQPNLKLPLYALQYVILIYVLREADFHRLFTDEHITKLKFYTDPSIDLSQRIIGGIPMTLFFIFFFYLLTRYTGLVVRQARQMAPWAIATCLWAATLISSQIIDKSDWNKIYYGRVVEEMLELCASGYLCLAVLFSRKILISSERKSTS